MKTKRCNDTPHGMTLYSRRACLLFALIAVTTLCSSSVTSAATRTRPLQRGAENKELVDLKFALPDAYGREVRAGDYRSLPLLIMVGACW
jgi:hypothetical protein